MKRIVTDSSNFKDLRQRDAYYVDKTPQIVEFFEYSNNIILMPRPRRFGKTLFLSTMNYLFSNQEGEAHLFQETSVYDTPFFKEHFGKYPVISITFKDVKESNFTLMLQKMQSEIQELCALYKQEIIQSKKSSLINILNNKASQAEYENSLHVLSEVLTSHYKTPCIILIDDYDIPIMTAYFKNYHIQATNFFGNMLGAVLKDNDLNIKKALITGTFRILGGNMLSGLNNVNVVTILENTLSSSCGFTNKETLNLLNYYNIEDELKQKVMEWFGDYIIANKRIVNPFSLLNFVKNRQFKLYLVDSFSNNLLFYFLQQSQDFLSNLEKLLHNKPIDIEINKHLILRNEEIKYKDNLFSLLLFGGYLKCREKYIVQNDNGIKYHHCIVMPTNIESQMLFQRVINLYVRGNFKNIEYLIESLTSGDLERFEELLSYALLEVVSYHDTTTENSYHMFLLGILTNLSNSYEIISNAEAGYGRVDIILLHKKDKNRPAIVMELKEIDEFEEETKEEALQKAVKQIEEKNYIALAQKRGYNNILAFGVVFDGKRCWIKNLV